MIREYTPYEKKQNANTITTTANNNNENKKLLVDQIYYGTGKYMRQTSINIYLYIYIACELECDVDVNDILNTKIVTEYQQRQQTQLDSNFSCKLPSLQGAIDEDKRLRDVFDIGSQPNLLISEIKERKGYNMSDNDKIWYEKVGLIIEESHVLLIIINYYI